MKCVYCDRELLTAETCSCEAPFKLSSWKYDKMSDSYDVTLTNGKVENIAYNIVQNYRARVFIRLDTLEKLLYTIIQERYA